MLLRVNQQCFCSDLNKIFRGFWSSEGIEVFRCSIVIDPYENQKMN